MYVNTYVPAYIDRTFAWGFVVAFNFGLGWVWLLNFCFVFFWGLNFCFNLYLGIQLVAFFVHNLCLTFCFCVHLSLGLFCYSNSFDGLNFQLDFSWGSGLGWNCSFKLEWTLVFLFGCCFAFNFLLGLLFLSSNLAGAFVLVFVLLYFLGVELVLDLWRLYSIFVWTLGGFWSFGWTFWAWTFAWTFVLAFNFFFYIVFSLCLNLCCGISVLLGFLLVFQFLPGLMLVSSTSFNFEFSLGRNISKSYADIICLDNGASSVIAHLFSEGKAITQSSEERVCSTLLWRASRYEKKWC